MKRWWVICGALIAAAAMARAAEIPITGRDNPKLKPIDQLLLDFAAEKKVPGMAVAITKGGRLVYARGFGYGDVEAKQPVQPDSLFRIASNSKPITAAAIMQLVERKKLSLDEKVFPFLGVEPFIETGKQPDPRLQKITIAHLLCHTGGWEQDKPFDPMLRSGLICKAMKIPPPARQADTIRFMLGQPLNFDPGTTYSYSNFGYCVLGRVIEKVSGQTYEQYCQQNVLAPLGIKNMRLGRTLLADRASGEVKYYESEGDPVSAVMGPDLGKPVQRAYGGFCLEAMDSHGGWLASAPELVRFASAFDFPQRCKILKPQTIDQLFAPPPSPPGARDTAYYAIGWRVKPNKEGRRSAWHSGRLHSGTASFMLRRSDGVNFTVIYNTAPPEGGDGIDTRLNRAINQLKPADWPAYDLFTMPPQKAATIAP